MTHEKNDRNVVIQDLIPLSKDYLKKYGLQPLPTSPKEFAIALSIHAAYLAELSIFKEPMQVAHALAMDPVFKVQLYKSLTLIVAYNIQLSHLIGMDITTLIEKKLEKTTKKYPPVLPPTTIFSGKNDLTSHLQELKDLCRKFRDDRNWAQFHNPKDLSIGVVEETAELLELFAMKTDAEFAILMQQDASFKEHVHEEIGDIFLYPFHCANICHLDFTREMTQ